jgi:WD40 repeat protein
LRGHSDWALCEAFSPDGQFLASGSFRYVLGEIPLGEIKIWDRMTGKEIRTLSGWASHLGPVTGVGFSPDGQRLASGGWDGKVKIWDLSTGEVLHTLGGHTKYVNSVAFNSDGLRVPSGSGDRTVRIRDATTGNSLRTLRGHTGGVYSVAFHPDAQEMKRPNARWAAARLLPSPPL